MKYSISSKYYLTIKNTVRNSSFEKKKKWNPSKVANVKFYYMYYNKIYFNILIETESYGTYKPAKHNISLINSAT